jgi:hypothetical protein
VKKERRKLRLARVAGGRRRDGGTHTGFFLRGACGRGLSAEAYPERGLQLAASYSLSYLEFVTAISKLYTFESNICIYSFLFPKLISY